MLARKTMLSFRVWSSMRFNSVNVKPNGCVDSVSLLVQDENHYLIWDAFKYSSYGPGANRWAALVVPSPTQLTDLYQRGPTAATDELNIYS